MGSFRNGHVAELAEDTDLELTIRTLNPGVQKYTYKRVKAQVFSPGQVRRPASGAPRTRPAEQGTVLDQGDRGNPALPGEIPLIREERKRRWRRSATTDFSGS
jgi:hypothetical protein